jgi:hypothetical protein
MLRTPIAWQYTNPWVPSDQALHSQSSPRRALAVAASCGWDLTPPIDRYLSSAITLATHGRASSQSKASSNIVRPRSAQYVTSCSTTSKFCSDQALDG